MDIDLQQTRPVRFNTQPPEGGWVGISRDFKVTPSFNTQPPEGGWLRPFRCCTTRRRFNTQPPEGGWLLKFLQALFIDEFQHTAA